MLVHRIYYWCQHRVAVAGVRHSHSSSRRPEAYGLVPAARQSDRKWIRFSTSRSRTVYAYIAIRPQAYDGRHGWLFLVPGHQHLTDRAEPLRVGWNPDPHPGFTLTQARQMESIKARSAAVMGIQEHLDLVPSHIISAGVCPSADHIQRCGSRVWRAAQYRYLVRLLSFSPDTQMDLLQATSYRCGGQWRAAARWRLGFYSVVRLMAIRPRGRTRHTPLYLPG
ncbi:hypothetical protein BJY00DRAFT_72344 [Aspergillus carlsbadensis]|nr:hypothetical protein BJY00DRAFT_72344 [Aspergillus carlsbadensis]